MSRARFVTIGVVVASAVAKLVIAEPQADIAARENEEGKELMLEDKYDDAADKLRDAVARVPEPKYFFNLCTCYYQQGKFGEALTACNSAGRGLVTAPDDKLKDKIVKLEDRVRDQAKQQGLDLQPVGGGGGDPNTPPPGPGPGPTGDPNAPPGPGPGTTTAGDPNQPPGPGPGPGPGPTGAQPVRYAPVHGRPPSENLFKSTAPDHNYTWTLGFDLFAGPAKFQGQVGGADAFGTTAGGFRVKGDVLLNRRARVGAEGWISYTSVTDNANAMVQSSVGELDIIDVGAGLYKHLCFRGVERLCLTPMIGASIAFMDPNQDSGDGMQTFNYLAAGVRGEVAAQYAFGRRYEHVVSLALDARYYTAAFADPSDGSPPRADVGLADAGTIVTVGIGYTYRFNTPLGGRALFTLE